MYFYQGKLCTGEGFIPVQSRTSALLFITQQPQQAMTLARLVQLGIPVQQSKYKWNAVDRGRLNAALQLLATNQEQPPRPPGKSPVTWIKEDIFPGYGPSEEQIRKMLFSLKSS